MTYKHLILQFGIMSCTAKTAKYCTQVSYQPVVVIQQGAKRKMYQKRDYGTLMTDFIDMAVNSQGEFTFNYNILI